MGTRNICFTLLAIAVAGCRSQPIDVGSGGGGNVVPVSDGTAPDPDTCSDVHGISHPSGQSFLCGFDNCNQCACVGARLVQKTFTACAPVVSGSDGGEGGIASDAGQGDGPMLSASCSDLVPGGLDVRIAFQDGPPPDLGKGGTIADGIYHLIQSTIYQTMPTSQTFTERETIRISEGGTHLEYVTASGGFTMSESIAPAGASLHPTTLCPGPGVSVGPYFTATPDRFTVVNGLYVKVFTRLASIDGGTAPAAACSTIAGGGPTIVSRQNAGPPPDLGRGGTIVDGLYDLTAFTYYNGGGGPGSFDSETIRISGGGTKLEYVSGVYNFGMSISLAPSGTALQDKVLCPADQPSFNMFVGPYFTASPGQFISVGQGYVKVFQQRVTEPILIP